MGTITLNESKNFNLSIVDLFSTLNWTNDQIERGKQLINTITKLTCGEVVEDYNVSDEKIKNYRTELINNALDQRVFSYINKLNLNGSASHKKSEIGLFSVDYDDLILNPTFKNYIENYLKKGVYFSNPSKTNNSYEESILNELQYVVENLKQSIKKPLPIVTLGSEIKSYFSVKVKAEKAQTFNNVNGKLLISKSYYNELIKLIEDSKSTIEITMFYINISTDVKNPINKILNKLVDAKNRGVVIRVILDKDKEGEVYNSRLINKKAYDFLKTKGINVKWDSTTYLTHSKVIVFDLEYTIIGSHNWTLNSLFSYDETSVIIKNNELANFYTNSFNEKFNS